MWYLFAAICRHYNQESTEKQYKFLPAEDGKIDWEKLVKYNSGKSTPKAPAVKKKKVGKLEKLKKKALKQG